MRDLEEQVAAVVRRFVTEVSDLARAAAVDTLRRALTDGAAQQAAPTDGKTPRLLRPAAAAPQTAMQRGRTRTDAQVRADMQVFLDAVRADPGRTMEHYRVTRGLSSDDMALPVRRLLADKLLRVEGRTRATRYYPARSPKL